MGNCCTVASSMEWDDQDHWGSVTSKHKVFDEFHHGLKNVEKERLIGSLRASSDENGQVVKIMISKKELEELLGGKGIEKHDVGGARHHASAEQVLVRLMNAKVHVNDHHHSPWRPVLESIPELN